MTGSNRLDSLGNTCFIVGDFVVRAYFVVDNKNNDVVKSITFTSLRDELVSRHGVNTISFMPEEFNKLMSKMWDEYLSPTEITLGNTEGL